MDIYSFFRNPYPLIICLMLSISCSQPAEQKEEITTTVTDTSAAARMLEDLTTQINASPSDPGLLHRRAKIYIARNDFPNALTDMQKVLQLDSMNAEYYVTYSDIQLAGNRPSKAKESLEKSIELDPKNIGANMKLGELFFIAQQYDNMFKYINNVLKEDVHNAKAYMMKGMAYKELGDTARSISNFKTAIEQDPEYYPPFMQLAIIYTEKNDALALQYFNGALNIYPSSEEALYGRAMWYQENARDYDKAIQDYTSLLQVNPTSKYAHFNLGYVHYEYLKVYDQAIKHYTDAINADPNYAEAYYNRGLSYESVGNIAAARQDYEKALSIREQYELARQGLERVKK